MLTRLPKSFSNLAPEQRRVALAALLVLVSMLLPWYSKSSSAVVGRNLQAVHEAKLAILVPSFVEASIFLVAIAVLALMFFRGEGRAFHLPFGDGIVCTAAGAWVAFLVFYRFVDQPAGGKSNNILYTYDLSWGIFFGLLAAAFLIYSGTRLRLANVGEPPIGDDGARPARVAPRTPPPTTSQEDRERRRAERAARRGEPAPPPAVLPGDEDEPPAPTAVAPPRSGRPARPPIDGGTQLSFDEPE